MGSVYTPGPCEVPPSVRAALRTSLVKARIARRLPLGGEDPGVWGKADSGGPARQGCRQRSGRRHPFFVAETPFHGCSASEPWGHPPPRAAPPRVGAPVCSTFRFAQKHITVPTSASSRGAQPPSLPLGQFLRAPLRSCVPSATFVPAASTPAARGAVSTRKSAPPVRKTPQRHRSDSQETSNSLHGPVGPPFPPPHPHTDSAPAAPASLITQSIVPLRDLCTCWPLLSGKAFALIAFRALFPHLRLAEDFLGVVDTGMRSPLSSSGRAGLFPGSSYVGHSPFQGQPCPRTDPHGV